MNKMYESNGMYIREKSNARGSVFNDFVQKMPLWIQGLGRHARERGFYIKRSGGEAFMFIIVCDGILNLNYDGDKFALKRGDICMINTEKNHKLSCDESDMVDYYFVYLRGTVAQKYYDLMYCEKFDIHNCSNPENYTNYILSAIKYYDNNNDVLMINQINTMIMTFIYNINNQICKEYIFEKCNDYIQNNLGKKIHTIYLAQILNKSISQTTRYFKEKLNVTPYQYILEQRLHQSTKMLLNTDATLDYIAKKTGFGSASQYISKFKKKYKITPNEFRHH